MMTKEAKGPAEVLAPGQLWKTENGYILVTEEGKRVISYKKLRDPNQRAALTNLIRPEALVAYLNEVAAELMPRTLSHSAVLV